MLLLIGRGLDTSCGVLIAVHETDESCEDRLSLPNWVPGLGMEI